MGLAPQGSTGDGALAPAGAATVASKDLEVKQDAATRKRKRCRQLKRPTKTEVATPEPKVVTEEPSLAPAEQQAMVRDKAPKRGRPRKAKGKQSDSKPTPKSKSKPNAKAKARSSKQSSGSKKGKEVLKTASKSKRKAAAKAAASKAKVEQEQPLEAEVASTDIAEAAPKGSKKAPRRKTDKTSQTAEVDQVQPQDLDQEAAASSTGRKRKASTAGNKTTKKGKETKTKSTTNKKDSATEKKKQEAKQRNARKSLAYRQAQKAAQDEGKSPEECKAAARQVL